MTDTNFRKKRKTQMYSESNRVRTTSVEPPADPDDPQNTIRVRPRLLMLLDDAEYSETHSDFASI